MSRLPQSAILMIDYCLTALSGTGEVVVEGAFAANDLYLRVLATVVLRETLG